MKSLTPLAIRLAEQTPLPDALRRAGVRALVGATQRRLANSEPDAEVRFAREMTVRPIAEFTAVANDQHYEVPAAFFRHVLGPRLKYSCCLFVDGAESLAEAEEAALAETCAHADLRDGQSVLELGCGWGSLTLWLAQRHPQSRITAVSNSHSQRRHVEEEAERLGLANVRVVTADANTYAPEGRFDRIVSVEMFEHMANWRALFARVRSWLEPDGRLFLHVFTHRDAPYRFDASDPDDWIGQHFFTGGIMPSHGLAHRFGDLMTVEQSWRWSGRHYQRTAEAWLENFDRNADAIRSVLAAAYGPEARLWARRWRLFFLATAGLFGHGGGEPWAVSHYRLRAAE
jgi:cyclopropane-fatty-acyl-phospholipid synthase